VWRRNAQLATVERDRAKPAATGPAVVAVRAGSRFCEHRTSLLAASKPRRQGFPLEPRPIRVGYRLVDEPQRVGKAKL